MVAGLTQKSDCPQVKKSLYKPVKLYRARLYLFADQAKPPALPDVSPFAGLSTDFKYFSSVNKPPFILLFLKVQSDFECHKWTIIPVNMALLFKMNSGRQGHLSLRGLGLFG